MNFGIFCPHLKTPSLLWYKMADTFLVIENIKYKILIFGGNMWNISSSIILTNIFTTVRGCLLSKNSTLIMKIKTWDGNISPVLNLCILHKSIYQWLSVILMGSLCCTFFWLNHKGKLSHKKTPTINSGKNKTIKIQMTICVLHGF